MKVLNREVSKGDSALRLKQMLGFDRIISFGDNINDLSLFESSDECYAVGNAVNELKTVSSGVIGGNSTNGVAVWLSQNFEKGNENK